MTGGARLPRHRSARRGWRAAAALAGALLLAPVHAQFVVPGTGVQDGVPGPAGQRGAPPARGDLAFAVLSDTPHNDTQARLLARTLDQLAPDSDLVLHLGNFKGEAEVCNDALYARRRTLLDDSLLPLVVLPGDNDWADCRQPAAGGYTPFERLTRLRELFFERPDTLGQRSLPLHRQSETARFRGYPENARWIDRDLMFVTLNVPGGQNNFQRGAGRNGELEERALANDVWLQQAFTLATRDRLPAIVVAFHGDPDFARDAGRSDAYGALKRQLAQQAASFRGQVLILHGSATALHDQPVVQHGKRLTNVVRIGVPPNRAGTQWLRIVYRRQGTPHFVAEARDATPP